ncbi:MAG: NADAR family protein [Propionibacteriaceae bacterium]|nr:NADAR family protein [Propionibacteriaceae bacterium]
MTGQSLMPPPWLAHPRIPFGSIGWRMGDGESYLWRWHDWFEALPDDPRNHYRELFPAPLTWPWFYEPVDEDGETQREDEDDYCLLGLDGECLVAHWQRHGRPRYNRRQLLAAPPEDFVFFWKPDPGVIGPACLGQWQPSQFWWPTGAYSCAEQYMMAEKSRLFGDKDVAAQIMAADDPKQMKALGRQAKGFDGRLWDKAKHSIVLNGNYAKFAQNPGLRDYLLSTGDAVLVEASPLDAIWGIGLGETNPKAHDPGQWRGQNLLGFALMEVRHEIRRVWGNSGLLDWTTIQPTR